MAAGGGGRGRKENQFPRRWSDHSHDRRTIADKRWTDGPADGQSNSRTNKRTELRAVKRTGGRTNGPADERTVRQNNRPAYRIHDAELLNAGDSEGIR